MENKHKAGTANQIIVRRLFSRPKVALRRITDPTLRLLVKSYDHNRRTQAEATARKAVEDYIG